MQSQVKSFVPLILEKYKDPKTSISTAVTESLTQIHKFCLTLSDLAEDLNSALSHKNPKIKVDTAKLLQVCLLLPGHDSYAVHHRKKNCVPAERQSCSTCMAQIEYLECHEKHMKRCSFYMVWKTKSLDYHCYLQT